MPFTGFDLSDFWARSDYALKEYVDDPLTADMVAIVEQALGYRLPAAYIALCATQNGGCPARTAHRTRTPTSWAEDHIAVTGIYAIGGRRTHALLGALGSAFWIAQWDYPPIGIYFADCPSAGHDMICLDYRECGPAGEPRVVHVDQERDFAITHVADNFEWFVRGLEPDEAFD